MVRLRLPITVALITLAAACAEPVDAPRPVSEPAAAPAQGDAPPDAPAANASVPVASPAGPVGPVDLKTAFLRDDSGAVIMDVPPEILVDLRAQLRAAGRDDVATALVQLYDPATGHVRDAALAARVQAAPQGGAR